VANAAGLLDHLGSFGKFAIAETHSGFVFAFSAMASFEHTLS
jgi:hypothetical protein